MQICVSQTLILPISIVNPLQKMVKAKKIRLSNFRELKSHKNLCYTQLQKEKKYCSDYNLKIISHVPHTAKIKKFPFRNTFLQIRETGIITLITYYSKNENEDPVVVIKRMKKAFKGGVLKNIIGEILDQFPEYEDNITDKKLKLRFNPPVTTIFQLLSKQEIEYSERHCEEIKNIGKYLGNANISVRRHLNDFRMVSKSFNALLSFDETISKKGRRILREGILQSIHLAHGLTMMYDRIATMSVLEFSVDEWRIFLNYYNPYVLSENEFTSAIIGTALKQTWFKEVAKLFHLKSKIRSLLLNIVREGGLKTDTIFYLTISLRKLPYKDVPIIILPAFSKPPQGLSVKELEIVNVLYDQHRKELSRKEEKIDLKYGVGLTLNKILVHFKETRNQKNYNKFSGYLNNLIKNNIVGYSPYKGPGRRENRMLYFIKFDMIEFTDQLIRFIGEKFPQ